MELQSILDIVCQFAPLHLAEPWDKVGLQVGDPSQQVKKALMCIDLTEKVIDEAITGKVDLILAYHSPIFMPLEKLTTSDWKQRVILKAAQNNIAIFSPHTALDAAAHGVNDWLARGLEQSVTDEQISIIRPAVSEDQSYKIVTFAPAANIDAIRSAMAVAGAGQIGDYSDCSFALEGQGTFCGGSSTSPTIGQAGRFETVSEIRLEMVANGRNLPEIVRNLRKFHPYEEPAFDIYQLKNPPQKPTQGQGRIVKLRKAVSARQLADRIKKHLGVKYLDVTVAKQGKSIKTIGLCAGGGGSLLEECGDIDAFFTGEMRHHSVLNACQNGISVFLAGHTQTERPYLKVLKRMLSKEIDQVQWMVSKKDKAPSGIC